MQRRNTQRLNWLPGFVLLRMHTSSSPEPLNPRSLAPLPVHPQTPNTFYSLSSLQTASPPTPNMTLRTHPPPLNTTPNHTLPHRAIHTMNTSLTPRQTTIPHQSSPSLQKRSSTLPPQRTAPIATSLLYSAACSLASAVDKAGFGDGVAAA